MPELSSEKFRVVSWEHITEFANTLLQPVSLTIGVFDALHRGHQALIEKITDFPDAVPTVVTFRNNPAAVLNPNSYPGDVLTLHEKLDGFRRFGVEQVILIDFSPDFGKLTGNTFLRTLTERFTVRYLAIGSNFHCGHKMDTDADQTQQFMEERGIPVTVIDSVQRDGDRISSTRIRTAIRKGDLKTATEFLRHDYRIELEPSVYRVKQGKALAEKSKIRQVLPPEGTYTVTVEYTNWKDSTQNGKNGKTGNKRALPLQIDKDFIHWNERSTEGNTLYLVFTGTSLEKGA
ncbi:MAG: hypothetical protein K9L68_09630 [Spirochaetales bacterium]|nr:hypothetical protein [Spirochaetales bacterium]MCF7938845.1 hypothetical protein [Spirochaetales bacterium]